MELGGKLAIFLEIWARLRYEDKFSVSLSWELKFSETDTSSIVCPNHQEDFVGALITDFLDPFCISLFQSIIWEIFMGCFPVAFFETEPLDVPLVASDKTCIIERWGRLVDSFIENELVIFCNEPIFDRVWALDDVA